jgi:hypothetical protein
MVTNSNNYNEDLILNSITNNLDDGKKDSVKPFSLFEFVNFSKIQKNDSNTIVQYKNYLQRWNKSYGNSISDENNVVREQFINLFKEITLKYTTDEEKRYLQNIDFSDEENIFIAVPFFSRKIKEIILYYQERRKTYTRNYEEIFSKGNKKNLKNYVKSKLIDFFQEDEKKDLSTITSRISSIQKFVEIEIEDCYDVYNDYFDIDPSKPPEFYSSSQTYDYIEFLTTKLPGTTTTTTTPVPLPVTTTTTPIPVNNIDFNISWNTTIVVITAYEPGDIIGDNSFDRPRINTFRSDGNYVVYMSAGNLVYNPEDGTTSSPWGDRSVSNDTVTIPISGDEIAGVDLFTSTLLPQPTLTPDISLWTTTITNPNEIKYQYTVDVNDNSTQNINIVLNDNDVPVITEDTEINIFFDSSGSMDSTLAPLQIMRDQLLEASLLPFYNNDRDLYLEKVTVIEDPSEQTFEMLSQPNNDLESPVLNIVFQDESSPYGADSNNYEPPTAQYLTDIVGARSNLINKNDNRYIIFQVATNPGGYSDIFKAFLQSVENGTGSYGGSNGLSDVPYNSRIAFEYDIIPAASPGYYANLLISTMQNLGYVVEDLPKFIYNSSEVELQTPIDNFKNISNSSEVELQIPNQIDVKNISNSSSVSLQTPIDNFKNISNSSSVSLQTPINIVRNISNSSGASLQTPINIVRNISNSSSVTLQIGS